MATQGAGPFPGRAIHGNRLICVVDRDADRRQELTHLLNRIGYRVEAASSEDDARRSIGRQLPDLVIAHLPAAEEDALAFFQALRLDRRTAALPVIALTSSGGAAGARRCLDAGATDCLVKPFEVEALYFAIQKAIEHIPRRNLRIRLRMPVCVNDSPLACGAAGCDTVLSVKGMYVQTRQTAPERELLAVRFVLGSRQISVHGKVLFSDYPGRALGRESGMGIYFTKIAPEDEAYLRQYINDSITTGSCEGRTGDRRR